MLLLWDELLDDDEGEAAEIIAAGLRNMPKDLMAGVAIQIVPFPTELPSPLFLLRTLLVSRWHDPTKRDIFKISSSIRFRVLLLVAVGVVVKSKYS